MSERAAKRAAKWQRVGAIKVSRGCESGACPIDPALVKSDPVFLDLDHIDPSTKKDSVSNLIRSDYAWPTIQAEIDKCRVLCKFCHAKHTADQRKG